MVLFLDFVVYDYVEEEFMIFGIVNIYKKSGWWCSDGEWGI